MRIVESSNFLEASMQELALIKTHPEPHPNFKHIPKSNNMGKQCKSSLAKSKKIFEFPHSWVVRDSNPRPGD